MKSVSNCFKLKSLRSSSYLWSPSELLPRPHHYSQAAVDQPILLEDFTTFCYQRDLPRAIKVMAFMHTHRIWADSITYSELLKCCLARGAFQEAQLVHKHIFSGGYQPKTFLINTFLNTFVKFNLMDQALELFDQMPERNVVSWTTLISAFANAKFNGKAMELLIQMLRDGTRPNMFTYSSLLRACKDLPILRELHCNILKVGLESDVFVRSALIDNYSKWGELSDALYIFNEMETKDLVVWNSIISGFAQNSEGGEAMDLFKSMKRAGFMVDQGTLTSVLRACTALTLLKLGRQVHVHVLKFNRDLILNNALLDMYCKCGSLEDAKSVYTRMMEKDVISCESFV